MTGEGLQRIPLQYFHVICALSKVVSDFVRGHP